MENNYNEKKKFYQKKWFTIVMLIFFFPIGLFLMWKYKHFSKRTRKGISIFFIIVIIAGIFFEDELKKESEEKKEEENFTEEWEQFKREKEEKLKKLEEEREKNKSEDVDEGEEDEENNEDKDEEFEEIETDTTSRKQKDNNELLDDTKTKVNIRTGAKYFIEEYEKQRIKKLRIDNIAVYSNDTVKDQAGNEFEYSFMVTGRYEEKGTGGLRDFVMTLGYRDQEAFDKGLAGCIQYLNDDTQTYINVMDPDDDVILKLLEATNN